MQHKVEKELIRDLTESNDKMKSKMDNVTDAERKDFKDRIHENEEVIKKLKYVIGIESHKTEDSPENYENSSGLFDAILDVAFTMAFKFAIRAAGHPEMYNKSNEDLAKMGLTSEEIECREALDWIMDDDDKLYKIQPYTFSFICNVLGSDINSIRRAFKALVYMSPKKIQSAWNQYKSKSARMAENKESNEFVEWINPTEKDLEKMMEGNSDAHNI